MGKQNSLRLRAHCLFCDKVNRRHTRLGRTFTCEYCGELNPGPGLKKAMAKLISGGEKPPAKKTPAAPASTPAPKSAARKTSIRSSKSAAPAAPVAGPPSPKVASPGKASPAPAPPKASSGWDRVKKLVYD